MSDYQISHHRPDSTDADRRIEGLKGPVCAYLGIDDIIRRIDGRQDRFWTTANGQSVWIETATATSGRRYLKTTADSYYPNNLLALPVC